MAPAKPPFLPPKQGELAHEYVRRHSLPFGEIPEAVVVTHHGEHVKRWTDATKIFWGAVTLGTAIISGSFYAGVQFANLKAEFQLQMAGMLTKKQFDEALPEVRRQCRSELISDLQSDQFRFMCPAFTVRGQSDKPCRLRDVTKSQ